MAAPIQSPSQYRGGKYKHLDFLLPLMPVSHTYIELFGGMGSIMWNKRPVSCHNVYNDLDSRLVCVFECIRDHHEELGRRLKYTPHSREEFNNAVEKLVNEDFDDKIDKARCSIFVLNANVYKSFGRLQKNAFSGSLNKKLDRVGDFHPRILSVIAGFLLDNKVLIENMKAEDLLVKAEKNADEAFIYIDPPYLASREDEGDAYGLIMYEEDHEELLKVVKASRHKIAVSNYHSELYDDMLSGWYLDEHDTWTHGAAGHDKSMKTECLWRNYEIKPIVQEVLF